jgi:TetR/AcrR family transcriptional regulator
MFDIQALLGGLYDSPSTLLQQYLLAWVTKPRAVSHVQTFKRSGRFKLQSLAMSDRPVSITHPNSMVPRVRDADATRSRVLEAAETLFARKGFDGTRLREVAEVAKVTVPLVCHHFRDKDSLYTAVVERGLERFASLGWGVLRQGITVAEQLEGFVSGLVDMGARDPNITAILHREMAEGGGRARPLAERLLLPLKHAATEVLMAAQERGEIRRKMDVDMLVLHIAGAALYPCLAAPLVQIVWGEDPNAEGLLARRKRELVGLLLPLIRV